MANLVFSRCYICRAQTLNIKFQEYSAMTQQLSLQQRQDKNVTIRSHFFSFFALYSPLIITPPGGLTLSGYLISWPWENFQAMLSSAGVYSLNHSSRLLVLVVELCSRLLYDIMHPPIKCMTSQSQFWFLGYVPFRPE